MRRISALGLLRSPGRCLVLALGLLSFPDESFAVDRRWNNGSGSFVFGAAGNWQGSVTPGVLDVAQFGISAPLFPAGAYTVNFNNSATNQALHIEDDLVTFNLNSRVYAVTAATGLVIANQSNSFSARLTVTNGTISSASGSNFDVGAVANKTGTLNVSTSGRITGSPNLNIGKVGTGALNVDSGGVISTTGATNIGVGNGVTGTATILGNASPASASLITGTLNVGSSGNGTVNVQIGGLLQNSGNAQLGTGSLFTGVGTGIVNVMNAGSVWNSLGLLEVGAGGTGIVNVTLGGTVNGSETIIGASTSRGGEVNVNGLNSKWDNSGTLTIGGIGSGMLNITNQGVVETTDGVVGAADLSTSNGTVNVTGSGSQWTTLDDLKVGFAGNGTLNITAGGTGNGAFASIGYDTSSEGVVNVDGAGSVWELANSVGVGVIGKGTLNITNGGEVRVAGGGEVKGPGSAINIDGVGSLWESGRLLRIGAPGEAKVNITGGAQVRTVTSNVPESDVIGWAPGFSGRVVVDGAGSRWDSTTNISIGDEDNGILEITNGGQVRDQHGNIGVKSGGTGHVTVSGGGSFWSNLQSLTVGGEGTGTLDIADRGSVFCGFCAIGSLPGGVGSVVVDNGTWVNNSLAVGYRGVGALDIVPGGHVQSDEAYIGQNPGSHGTVNVASLAPGEFAVWDIFGNLGIGADPATNTNGGSGTLFISPGGLLVVTEKIVTSSGDFLKLNGGTLYAGNILFVDGGNADVNFDWTAGTLHAEVFNGDLVNQAGVLAPGFLIGTTQINGDYNQLADATLQMHVGGTAAQTEHDTLLVFGNMFLGGDLEVALVNGFVPASTDTLIVAGAVFNLFGEFANIANGQRLTTTDGRGSFVVNYGPGSAFGANSVTLSDFLAATLYGDYNDNGIVDVADYTIWRNSVGNDSLINRGEGITGPVGAADYAVWKTNFGASFGPGAGSLAAPPAVPEPSTLFLAAWSILALPFKFRPRESPTR